MIFSKDRIGQIMKEYYNLEAEVVPLQGYDEQNFLLKTSKEEKYICKVSAHSPHAALLEAQVAMLEHLYRRGEVEAFPEIVYNQFKKSLTLIRREGRDYHIRVLTFLEGDFWAEAGEKNEQHYKSLGKFLGKMDANLETFSHPATHRRYIWDISTSALCKEKLSFIRDHGKRRIADYFILQFETEVAPVIASLRHACIHNDANDYNILIRKGQVAGLIDFGDIVYTALINNLAIACAYAMLHTDKPLEVAKWIIQGYHEAYPLKEEEIRILYYLISARLCISVTQSAYQASLQSVNSHHFLSERPAWHLLHQLIRINPLKAENTFRQAAGFSSVICKNEPGEKLLLNERLKYIGRNLSLSYAEPVKMLKGALQYLYDDKGNTFVDCVNNVSHVGHCHPVVVRKMQKQIATLNTNTRYLHDDLINYAKALLQTLPSSLSVCYFTNSGSEANDLAVRMSRHYTGNQDIIVLDHAYHGTSTAAIEMSPYKFDGKGGFQQRSYIHKAVSPDVYRGLFKREDADAGKKYAACVQKVIEEVQKNNVGVAAFICETLLGVGGQIPLPANYLKEVYSYIRNAGGVCIADEVQVGFGRVGEAFWGFELQEVEPDIVVMGKPIGNGHPLAVVAVTNEIADRFNNGMEYFNTFGGNPVSMVTGLGVLEVIQKEELQNHALVTGQYLLGLLQALMKDFQIIGDVRGHGLFIGAEFVKDRITKEPALQEIDRVVEEMKKKGFLLSTDGPLNNVLKIKPPLVFDRTNALEMVDSLREVLQQMT